MATQYAVALLVMAGAASDPVAQNRGPDPVVVEGAALPWLVGAAVDEVVGFKYDDGWVQIPVQVDERVVVDYGVVYAVDAVGVTTLAYADDSTYTGPDTDPAFDDDDEVLFMAADLGGPAPFGVAEPPGVLPGSGLRISVTDPLDGGSGAAYLFVSDGSLQPDAGQDYVAYTFNLLGGTYIPDYDTVSGPNPEDSELITDLYRVHFSDRWVRDEINIFAGSASGVDVLDRHKNMFAPGSCQRTEDTFSLGEGAFFVNKDGPVRAIRSYMGANSGPLTQRRHFFYAGREDVLTFLRVHPIGGIADMFDYSPDAAGMMYYDDLNLAGAEIDGVADPVNPGPITWQLVTGGQGSLAMSMDFQTDIPGFAYTSYYSDDLAPSVTQCTGDPFEYGTSGVWVDAAIPNTDPLLGVAFNMVGRRVIYYLPLGSSVDLAAALHQQAQTPLDVSAGVYEPGSADVNGDGTVDAGDLALLLGVWGPNPGNPADLNADGVVNATDLALLLGGWT